VLLPDAERLALAESQKMRKANVRTEQFPDFRSNMNRILEPDAVYLSEKASLLLCCQKEWLGC